MLHSAKWAKTRSTDDGNPQGMSGCLGWWDGITDHMLLFFFVRIFVGYLLNYLGKIPTWSILFKYDWVGRRELMMIKPSCRLTKQTKTTFRWHRWNDPFFFLYHPIAAETLSNQEIWGVFGRKYTGIIPAGAILFCKLDSIKSESQTHQREWDSSLSVFWLLFFLRLLVVLVAAHKESHI